MSRACWIPVMCAFVSPGQLQLQRVLVVKLLIVEGAPVHPSKRSLPALWWVIRDAPFRDLKTMHPCKSLETSLNNRRFFLRSLIGLTSPCFGVFNGHLERCGA